MLEYMDSIKETRTGVTRYNQGTDADTLNKTARGIQMIQAAGQQRTALIARIFRTASRPIPVITTSSSATTAMILERMEY